MHICIIGVAGVGKAHALSAAKFLDAQVTGVAQITLVDYEQQLRENLGPYCTHWVNEWGPIKDSYCIGNEFGDEYIGVNRISVESLKDGSKSITNMGVDLYIISTPNAYHAEYLSTLVLDNKTPVKILCEKPIVGANEEVDIRLLTRSVNLGIEWLLHPEIKNVKKLKSVEFIHGYPPEAAMWDVHHEVFDLGSHVISIYQYITGRDIVRFKSIDKSGRVVTCVTNDDIVLKFGYKKGVTTDTIVINGGKYELSWIPFNEGDLFYKQIEHIINNRPPMLDQYQISMGHEALTYIREEIQ